MLFSFPKRICLLPTHGDIRAALYIDGKERCSLPCPAWGARLSDAQRGKEESKEMTKNTSAVRKLPNLVIRGRLCRLHSFPPRQRHTTPSTATNRGRAAINRFDSWRKRIGKAQTARDGFFSIFRGRSGCYVSHWTLHTLMAVCVD